MLAHLRPAVLAALALALAATLTVADEKDEKDKKKKPDINWAGTPTRTVEKMLEVAKLTDKDVLYDLGCGDGRIVCKAAEKYKCKAVGYDIDPKQIEKCEARKAKLDKDVQKLVRFEKADMFTLDLSGATVVTLYLTPKLNAKLIPQLKKLKNGSRIVSHDFDMPGVRQDKGFPVEVKAKDDRGNDHTSEVYLWTTPLKVEKDKE